MNPHQLTKLLDSKTPKPKPEGDRESVLRATGRTDTPTSQARTTEQILRDNKALSEFLKLKDTI